MTKDCLPIDLPDWAAPLENKATVIEGDEARMRFAIDLARRNVELRTGGPFGAAIFRIADGRLLAIGINSVVRLGYSVMHAEMMAIMRAQRSLGSYTLRPAGCVLYSSCEPYAMCLGGILWSGIRRFVCGAHASAARAIGFDEGPVCADSYRHLEQAGIDVTFGMLSNEAETIIQLYQERNGSIYNA